MEESGSGSFFRDIGNISSANTSLQCSSLETSAAVAAASSRHRKMSVPCGPRGMPPMRKNSTFSSFAPRTPSSKTPNKKQGGGLGERKQSKSNPNTPSADRFIPSASILDSDLAYYKLMHQKSDERESVDEDSADPTEQMKAKERFDLLTDGQVANGKVLQLSNQPNIRGFSAKSVIPCSGSAKAATATVSRHIPSAPIKTLDAPDISPDFYLNIIDWSARNMVAVALGSGVYMWDVASGSIVDLVEFDDNIEVCSLKFSDDGFYLSVGVSDGHTYVFNAETKAKLRTLLGHPQRVGSCVWNHATVVTGSRAGLVLMHDLRDRSPDPHRHIVAHAGEVCGLAFNCSRNYLASGSSDTTVKIWSLNGTSNTSLHSLDAHTASVKALAWHPSEESILATGGGTMCKTIRLWNVHTGRNVYTVDTGSQVSGLGFSDRYGELASSHGFDTNQLTIWKYPSMHKVKDLTGHTSRIMCMCMSPDREIVVTAAEDETIRLWQVWPRPDDKKAKATTASKRNLHHGDHENNPPDGGAKSNLLLCQQR